MRLAPRARAGVPVVGAMPHARSDLRRVLSLLLLLVVAAVVLQATLHGAAVLAEAPPAPPVFMLVAAVALLAISPLRSAARPTCDSRAPPRS